jgi:hypothetical protein
MNKSGYEAYEIYRIANLCWDRNMEQTFLRQENVAAALLRGHK